MASKDFPLTLTIKAIDKATGPLRVMTGKIAKFTAPFRSFGKDLSNFSEAAGLAKIGAGFKGVGSAVGKVGGEAAALGAKMFALAGVAGFALFSIVKGAVDAGDKLGEMSQRVGLGVDVYASLQHAAAQADVSQEDFNAGMDTFNKRLGDMKAKGGPLLAFLNKTSPALAKQMKGAKGTESALSMMTDALSRIEDPQRRAALAAAAFGKSNTQMGQFLGQGNAAIQEQQTAYMRLAGSQEEFARNAGALDNAMRETETAFLGLRSAAMGALFPAFTKLSKTVTEFIVKNRDGIKQWAEGAASAITAWVEGGGLDRLVAGFREFASGVGKVVDFLGGFKGVAIAAGAVMAGPLIASVLGLVPAVISLGVALAPLAVALAPFLIAAAPFIAAAVGIGAAAYAIYDNWGGIKLFFSDLWTDTAATFQSAWAWISPIVDKVTSAAAIIANPMGAITRGASGALGGLLGFGSAAPLPVESARVPAAGVSSTATVEVNFNGAPAGMTAKLDRNSSQPVDLSVGRNMVSQ